MKQVAGCKLHVGEMRAARARGRFLFFVFCFLLIVLSACGGGEQDPAVNELELKLTAQAAPATADSPTAPEAESTGLDAETTEVEAPAAESGEQTAQTEQGDVSVEASPNPALQEAGATATARALDLAATSVAASAANDASQIATTEALAPIQGELASLGVDPNQGQLGFTHPPISIEVAEFESSDFANQNVFTIAQDFVMAADVTWESKFAESGCGFVVRSDGEEEAPSQYIIALTRGAQGHVLFAEQVAGDVDLDHVTDIYAGGIDPLFNWKSGATNRLVVVGRDQEFTIFSNGTRLGSVSGKSGFEEGFVAFITVNRSGGIKCDFDNAWLWKIN